MKILHVFTILGTAKSFFDGQFKYLADEGGYEIHVVSDSEPDEDFNKKNGVKYHRISIARRIDLRADMKTITDLRRLIKKEKYDAIIGHTPKGALVAMTAGWLGGVKNRIYYRHGYIHTTAKGARRLLLTNVERFTSSLSTKIVNVSESVSSIALKESLNNARKQMLIGSGTCGGIDTKSLFNPDLLNPHELQSLRKELGIGEKDFVAGYCGRICKEKGIRELIDGFNSFQDRHREVTAKLLLIGSFDTRDILPDKYRLEIENNENILYVGKKDKSELPKLYALMQVCLLPSYREGFPTCVLEASAMRIPVLVSKSHGCIDSIRENITGEYIDLSAQGVAKGLESMLNQDKRNRLGEEGRNFAVKNFDHSEMWPKVLSFYQTNFYQGK